MQPPTVFIIDGDDQTRRVSLSLVESFDTRASAFESASAFFDQTHPGLPGCIVLSFPIPDASGLEIVAQLRKRGYANPILALSDMASVSIAVEGMKRGLFDFLVRPVDPDILRNSLRAALLLDKRQRAATAEVEDIQARLRNLTPREMQILELIVAGLPTKNIGASIGIRVKTVENHRSKLMVKMGATNVADVVRMWMQAVMTSIPTPAFLPATSLLQRKVSRPQPV